MLDFRPVAISDKDWADRFLRAENSRSADYAFGNIYMWDSSYRQYMCSLGDRLLIKLKYGEKPFFAFPVGSGELRPAIETLSRFAAERGYPLCIRGVTDEQRSLLESVYPGGFSYCEDRDYSDYIYFVEKLSTMGGKKLHGKRNHCNRFEAEHDWEFLPLTPELIPECVAMLTEWTEEFEMPPEGIPDEHAAILRGFMQFRKLGLIGGVLRADGRTLGFTVGERICSDTVDVHFEKAFASVNGAYPMVSREFARLVRKMYPEVVYLNREDDMGRENLRKAKLDFAPEYLLKKYTACEVEV